MLDDINIERAPLGHRVAVLLGGSILLWAGIIETALKLSGH